MKVIDGNTGEVFEEPDALVSAKPAPVPESCSVCAGAGFIQPVTTRFVCPGCQGAGVALPGQGVVALVGRVVSAASKDPVGFVLGAAVTLLAGQVFNRVLPAAPERAKPRKKIRRRAKGKKQK